MQIYTDSRGLHGMTIWSGDLSDLLLYLSRKLRRTVREPKCPRAKLGATRGHDTQLLRRLSEYAARCGEDTRVPFETASSVVLDHLTTQASVTPLICYDYFVEMGLVLRWTKDEPPLHLSIKLFVTEKADNRIRKILAFEDRVRALMGQ